MTIRCGGMLRSITRNAHAIAVAVTAIVIEGQWFSRKCLADIDPARLLPTLRCGGRELRKLSHVRLVRHSKIRLPMSAYLIGRLGSSAFRLSTTAVVDVARGLVLLYGIGTSALPSWDPRMGRSNLIGGLAGSGRQVQADMRTHHIHRPARDTIPPPGGTRASSYWGIGLEPLAFD